MKTRYSLFSLLLLCGLASQAQSQINTTTIIPSDTKSNTSIFTNGEYTVHSKSDRNIYTFNNRNPCRVFIGVGTTHHTETGGLKVDYTVDNTPATQYGVQKDDVILALDGVSVHTQAELEYERDKHKQGDAFTLDILRNGGKMTIKARFKACTEEELKQAEEQKIEREDFFKSHPIHIKSLSKLGEDFKKFEFNERPILGIYKDEEAKGIAGVVIKEVIEGKGAEAAGLKAGDVLVIVDGKSLTKSNDLSNALSTHKPGDAVDILYIRNGKTIETEVTLSADRHGMQMNTERDPCKVFIGVYTSDFAMTGGKGVLVSGVIDGTTAKESAVQPGDVILTLDNQPVNTNLELRTARDKHKPGDQFRLTILRGEATMEIEATFKACPNTPEVIELGKIEADNQPNSLTSPETTLQLEVIDAYPNPTLGALNIRFEAKAIPTTVRITDAAGKTVYNYELNQFNGLFNEQINLDGKPGIYTLSIQQDKKVFTKKIVLLSRV